MYKKKKKKVYYYTEQEAIDAAVVAANRSCQSQRISCYVYRRKYKHDKGEYLYRIDNQAQPACNDEFEMFYNKNRPGYGKPYLKVRNSGKVEYLNPERNEVTLKAFTSYLEEVRHPLDKELDNYRKAADANANNAASSSSAANNSNPFEGGKRVQAVIDHLREVRASKAYRSPSSSSSSSSSSSLIETGKPLPPLSSISSSSSSVKAKKPSK